MKAFWTSEHFALFSYVGLRRRTKIAYLVKMNCTNLVSPTFCLRSRFQGPFSRKQSRNLRHGVSRERKKLWFQTPLNNHAETRYGNFGNSSYNPFVTAQSSPGRKRHEFKENRGKNVQVSRFPYARLCNWGKLFLSCFNYFNDVVIKGIFLKLGSQVTQQQKVWLQYPQFVYTSTF